MNTTDNNNTNNDIVYINIGLNMLYLIVVDAFFSTPYTTCFIFVVVSFGVLFLKGILFFYVFFNSYSLYTYCLFFKALLLRAGGALEPLTVFN